MRKAIVGLLLATLASASLGSAQQARGGDPRAAERQYRVARRLAAEGSPEAAAALRKVVELDPRGPLVDDALVEQALLEGIARWPEQIGRLGHVGAGIALAGLDRVANEFPRGDRAEEARYYRALVRLEPLAAHGAAAARLDLVAVATTGPRSPWSRRARYALAWLHEQRGEDEPALAAFQRLVIDFPTDEAASRARVGLGRILLREGRFGQAARRLQEAVDGEVPPETGAEPLRELAVRSLLLDAGAEPGGRPSTPGRIPAGIRAAESMAPLPDGGALLLSRREGRVVRLDVDGGLVAAWEIDQPQAIAVDPRGTAFAAAGESVYRLDAGGAMVAIGPLGELAPLAALAADGAGGFWLLDRRGQRIGRLAPGAAAPEPFWEDRGARLRAIVWDGRRLVAIDGRARSLLAFDADGLPRRLVENSWARPLAVASDPTGRLALLDGKTGSVSLLRSDGSPIETYLPATDGIRRPLALGLGTDGVLHLFDDADGSWVRRP